MYLPMQAVGTWTRCPNPSRTKVKHYWFKKPDYDYSFCDLCKYEIQLRNGTLVTNSNYHKHFKSNESKPEKDSL